MPLTLPKKEASRAKAVGRHPRADAWRKLIECSHRYNEGSNMIRQTPIPMPYVPPGGVTRYRDRIFDDLRHDPSGKGPVQGAGGLQRLPGRASARRLALG